MKNQDLRILLYYAINKSKENRGRDRRGLLESTIRCIILTICIAYHSFDMFEISHFDQKKYISETLKERLEKEKITGVEIKESKISLYINEYTGKSE